MKLDQNSAASAKERRLYYVVLSILAAVTVAAIIITIAAGGEDPTVDPLQQVEESQSQVQIPVEDSKGERVILEPDESQSEVVSGDMVEENSEIENVKADDTSEEESSTVEASVPEAPGVEEEAQVPEEEEEAPQTVAEFDVENDTMVWPVSGNVVMEYSADALIYDETLDQYRSNDSISIAATTGEEVLAAAAGTVKSIGKNDILGNYVVISHGNGLETTYGQLQDAVDVVVDQVVDKGEIIGYIAEPTWYCLALGSHVQFQVTQDGVAVDPTIYLENSMEE